MRYSPEEIRECTVCHQPMYEGYVINDGEEYFCCDDCLHGYYSEEEYEELCEQDAAYWTQWEIDEERPLKVLELFAGTRSIGKAFEARGHEVFSVEWDKKFEGIDLYADVLSVTAEQIIREFGVPDVIWASPDCTSYSMQAISTHRRKQADGTLKPITDYAKFCDEVNAHVVRLIRELNPRYWFIENPVGGLRKMDFMQGLPRYTVTYCQYGERRQKPTDIWTNHPDPKFKPACKRGAPCHDAAPRGSKTGTQGLKNSVEKAKIPALLCEHIVTICEEGG